MATTKNNMQTDYQMEVDVLTDHEDPCNLIVWNDEVNTFEWVIETLIEVCGHSLSRRNNALILFIIKGNML